MQRRRVYQVYKVEGYDEHGMPVLGDMKAQRLHRTEAEEDVRLLSSFGRHVWREYWV